MIGVTMNSVLNNGVCWRCGDMVDVFASSFVDTHFDRRFSGEGGRGRGMSGQICGPLFWGSSLLGATSKGICEAAEFLESYIVSPKILPA
eukprot:scaffold43396_cov60-Cyclotella_meneghiniana.AAC.1